MNTYLGFSRYVYTEGLWGKHAPEAYNRQIQGSEVLLAKLVRPHPQPAVEQVRLVHRRQPVAGHQGADRAASPSGSSPTFATPDRAGLVAAEDALRRDYHVRLFNRKWIEGMMKEGYAGADQIAVHVSNTMGWAIMRDGSVSDDTWNEIAAIYVTTSWACPCGHGSRRKTPTPSRT